MSVSHMLAGEERSGDMTRRFHTQYKIWAAYRTKEMTMSVVEMYRAVSRVFGTLVVDVEGPCR